MEFLKPSEVRVSSTQNDSSSYTPESSKADNNHSKSLAENPMSNYVPSIQPGYTLPNTPYLGTNSFCPPTNFNPSTYLNGLSNINTGTGYNFSNLSSFTLPNTSYLQPNPSLLSMYSNVAQMAFPPQGITAPTYNLPTSPFLAPQPVELDKKKLGPRRNSIPFSFIADNSQPIVSGSFSAGPANNWLEMARLRHTHSLENSLSVGVSATVGRRAKMEDEFLVVPFQGKQGDEVVGVTLPKLPATQFSDLPLPSSLARKRRPSITSFPEVDPMKRVKAMENSTPSSSPAPSSPSPNSVSPAPSNSPTPTEKKKPSYAFFAVYDGHGGTSCAEYVRMNLHSNIANHPAFSTDVEKAIIEGFSKTENDFAAEGGHPGCGTTACVALIYESVLYVANVGDSAAIVCRKGKPIELTTPHTMKAQSERDRIEACGGVAMDGRLAHPIWNPKLINIGVTRALGDMYFKDEQYTLGKPSGLISEPDIKRFPLTNDDKFILLGTDGFWDQISHQDSVDFVLKEKGLNARLVCKKLTDLVAKRSDSLDDNATVLLVKLKGDDDDVPSLAPVPSPSPSPSPSVSPVQVPTAPPSPKSTSSPRADLDSSTSTRHSSVNEVPNNNNRGTDQIQIHEGNSDEKKENPSS